MPVLYLRRFADSTGKTIRRRETSTGEEKTIGVRDACVIRDLNTAEEVLEAVPLDTFEDAMEAVDDIAAPFIEQLVGGLVPRVSTQARSEIASFIAWLFLRSPHSRSYIDLLTTREWRAHAAQDPDGVIASFRAWMGREPTTKEKDAIRRGDFDLEWPRGSQMKFAAKLQDVYEPIARYGWMLADAEGILTSDMPLTAYRPGEENLLGFQDVMFVPLSSTRVLVFREGPDLAEPVALDRVQAAALRRTICERAIDYTFRPPGAPYPSHDGTMP